MFHRIFLTRPWLFKSFCFDAHDETLHKEKCGKITQATLKVYRD